MSSQIPRRSSSLRDQGSLEERAMPVYLWATGQDDNIGDSLLRRGYMHALQALGPVTAWVGPASAAYIEGLKTTKRAVFHESFAGWYRQAALDAIKRPTVLALNAGELTISGRGAMRLLALMPLLGICRARGGRTFWLGASIPNHRSTVRWVYVLTAKICTTVRWREVDSQITSRRPGVMPDWGFGLGNPPEDWKTWEERPHFGIVLRGDRDLPEPDWFRWVSDTCTTLGLKPHVIVQVRRDGERAKEIAEILGCSITPWEEDHSHSKQESKVRDAFSECAVVVGDRLHGLIVAATEGAVPIGWTPTATDKIRVHFTSVGADWVGMAHSSLRTRYPSLDTGKLEELSRELLTVILSAREALAEVNSSVRVK